MSILITRPNHDLATNYLCLWTESVVEFSNKKGKTFDLKGDKHQQVILRVIFKSISLPLYLLMGMGMKLKSLDIITKPWLR